MPQRQYFLAASTVGFLVLIGGAVALDGACSPSAPPLNDAGVDAPVCDPDSSDPAGCACDPSTYKTSDCYTGPAGTNGKGICQTGKRSCNPNGTFTACVGEVTPQPEICNYIDDDCDGIIDDLPEIADAEVLAQCNSPACDPNYSDAAITCWGPDPGICGAGTKSCMGGARVATPTGCNEFIHGGVPEVCNGLDDDCNGSIDDGLDQEGPCQLDDGSTWAMFGPDANPFDGGNPKQILGACLNGNLTCVDSNCGEHACADAGDVCFPSQPGPEACDNKDNDCNGIVDDHACANNPYGYYYCCTYLTYSYCEPSTIGSPYVCNYAK